MLHPNLTAPVSKALVGPMHVYTGKERTAMREQNDWFDLQEEQEVEALLFQVAMHSEREIRLEAYDC